MRVRDSAWAPRADRASVAVMAESAFTSTASTTSSASTTVYQEGRRLHIVLDLDHTLVNASEHEQSRHHPRDASARQLHNSARMESR